MQLTKDGARILWLAHESAPKNFTAVPNVTDPKNPKIVARATCRNRICVPLTRWRRSGDILAVAYQTGEPGLKPAGFELFDISTPEEPRKASAFFECSGPGSRGVHQLWFADGKTIHMSAGAADFRPSHPKDDQFYRAIDVSNPSKPSEIGRWWLPGQQMGDNEGPLKRHPSGSDSGFRPHNTNVPGAGPGQVAGDYLDGGMIVLDIADQRRIPRWCRVWDYHPPNERVHPYRRAVLRPQPARRQRRMRAQ